MIFGVVVLLGQRAREQQAAEDIAKQYAELTRLNQGQASPENIDAAKKQEAQLREYMAKARGFFQRIPPIPNFTTNRIGDSDFATALRNTITQLTNSAGKQSVELPAEYYFSFESQRKLMVFDATNLNNMAVHLGEIKAICDILFSAKINYLIGIRREIISDTTDLNPPDYIADKTVSTPLADLTPYEVTFKSFSTELAEVLAGLASSTNAYVVKSINVEREGLAADDAMAGVNAPQPLAQPQRYPNRPYYPGGYPPPGNRGGFTPPYPAPAPLAQPARTSDIFLNEKPFRVTLDIEVVKMKRGK
jgi:hypothetical protein